MSILSDVFPHFAPVDARELLTSNRTYYVRTDGSDANDGLANTAGGAFLTIQKAVDVAATLDLGVYDVTIQIADGTYNGPVVCKRLVGSGKGYIRGNNVTPSNVIVNNSSGITILTEGLGITWQLRDFRVTSSSYGLFVSLGAHIEYAGLDFGACGIHIGSDKNAIVRCSGSYSISGGAAYHVITQRTGIFDNDVSGTCTITGTPNFTGSFVYCATVSSLQYRTMAFSGSATGKRYDVSMNGVIFTNGAGANYFPGNVAGTTATGGQYA